MQVAKKMEGERVTLRLRCKEVEITKIPPPKVSREISDLIGTDYSIVQMRDS